MTRTHTFAHLALWSLTFVRIQLSSATTNPVICCREQEAEPRLKRSNLEIVISPRRILRRRISHARSLTFPRYKLVEASHTSSLMERWVVSLFHCPTRGVVRACARSSPHTTPPSAVRSEDNLSSASARTHLPSQNESRETPEARARNHVPNPVHQQVAHVAADRRGCPRPGPRLTANLPLQGTTMASHAELKAGLRDIMSGGSGTPAAAQRLTTQERVAQAIEEHDYNAPENQRKQWRASPDASAFDC